MSTIDHIVFLGNKNIPRETCGYVFEGERVVQVRNIAPVGQFLMHPREQAAALNEFGTPSLVWHTHPSSEAQASIYDIASCNQGSVPWLIVAVPSGDSVTITPNDDIHPLKGRPYAFGVFDCLTLVRDYFRLRGDPLPDMPPYPPHWYRIGDQAGDYFESLGLDRIAFKDAKEGDVLGFKTKMDSVAPANHFAIYLGGNRMLEQAESLSKESVFDPHYVVFTLRKRAP
jgi:cell wall-associated NlpC family hydrolase